MKREATGEIVIHWSLDTKGTFKVESALGAMVSRPQTVTLRLEVKVSGATSDVTLRYTTSFTAAALYTINCGELLPKSSAAEGLDNKVIEPALS